MFRMDRSDCIVTQVVPSINRETGGPAASVTGLADGLEQAGIRCRLVTLDYRRHGPQNPVQSADLRTVEAGAATRLLRGWSPALAGEIMTSSEGSDLVHSHGLWMFPNTYARNAAASSEGRE